MRRLPSSCLFGTNTFGLTMSSPWCRTAQPVGSRSSAASRQASAPAGQDFAGCYVGRWAGSSSQARAACPGNECIPRYRPGACSYHWIADPCSQRPCDAHAGAAAGGACAAPRGRPRAAHAAPGLTRGTLKSTFSPTLKFRMLPVFGSATNTTVSASTPCWRGQAIAATRDGLHHA